MSPYDALEISSRATEEEVRAAYKTMAKKWHPDRMLDDQETATRKFKDINSAYRAILRERRREGRKRSSSPSTSSKPSQQKSNSTSSSSADQRDDSRYSPRSKSSQNDHARSTRSRERAKDGDASHDSHRYKAKGESLNEKNSNSEGSKKSSNPTNKPTSSDPTRSSRSHSSREPSPSPPSRSSSTSRSSKSSPSKTSSSTSSYNSGASTENLSSASSRTSVKSSPSSDSLPEHGRDAPGPSGDTEDHYAHPTSPNSSTPSFTSYTSSEVSAYDNPEITPPGASRNKTCSGQETKSGVNDTGASPRPARPPDEKLQSTGRERDHYNHNHRHHHHHKMRKGEEEDHEERTLIPEYDSTLARAVGLSKEWTYTIRLTLEELFYGKKLRFRVLRCKLDGKRKTVILDVDVPPGSVHGTQIIFRGAGHEKKDGTRQDIVFIIEEAKHERFVRVKEDLMLDVRLPWVEALKKEAAVVYAKGLDGKESRFEVDFAREGNVTGTTVIPGAGMPVPGTDKRGKLVVRWEIYMSSTTSRWGAIKQALSLP